MSQPARVPKSVRDPVNALEQACKASIGESPFLKLQGPLLAGSPELAIRLITSCEVQLSAEPRPRLQRLEIRNNLDGRRVDVGAGVGAAGGAMLTGGSAIGTVGAAAVVGVIGHEVSKDKK